MINGVGVVIFNDANVMTTDDIVTSCQRDRTPTSPGSAGRGVGLSRILVGTKLYGGYNMPPDWKTGVVITFNDSKVMTTDDIVTSCQRDRTPISPGSAGRAAGMLRIFVGQAYMVVIICDPVCKRGVVTFNDTNIRL